MAGVLGLVPARAGSKGIPDKNIRPAGVRSAAGARRSRARRDHTREAVRTLRESRADSVVSVVELPRHCSPDYVMRIEEGHLVPFLPDGARVTRRQDARPAFVRDGTVNAFWRRTLRETGSIYGKTCRPLLVAASDTLTIDTADDWTAAERRLACSGA